MRRGRALGLIAAALAALAAAPGVSAATPQDICRDLADGTLNGTYSAGDIAGYAAAFASDPSIQGYCTPYTPPPVVVTPPPETTTPPPSTNTPPPSTNTPPPSPSTPPSAGGVAPTPEPHAGPTTGGVLPGVSPEQPAGAPTEGTAGVEKTAAAPLNQARAAGVLPFTGTELTIFAIVGLALLASGLLLRSTARQR